MSVGFPRRRVGLTEIAPARGVSVGFPRWRVGLTERGKSVGVPRRRGGLTGCRLDGFVKLLQIFGQALQDTLQAFVG